MTALIRLYQKWLSPILPRSCRYYPSCSEFALQHFSHSSFIIAFLATIKRVLRCNQLFCGGIDYPIVRIHTLTRAPLYRAPQPKQIRFWLVPLQKLGHFYLIKNFKETSC